MTERRLPLGQIFTMVEAADALHISRRALQELVKVHPHYALNGHKKLFSEDDIKALWECMRRHSAPADVAAPTRSVSASHSEAYLYERVRQLTTKRKRSKNAAMSRKQPT